MNDKVFDILQQMDFKLSKADPDIWMRSSKDGTHYEYIAVYVDDLAVCMQDPQAICDTLKKTTNSSSKVLETQLLSWLWICQR